MMFSMISQIGGLVLPRAEIFYKFVGIGIVERVEGISNTVLF